MNANPNRLKYAIIRSMNLDHQPLLSLCIPTYNRSATLQQMLENLVALDVFKSNYDIEVVISDNASTDNTEQVARSFANRFPDRVRYYRNPQNVFDKNFGLALSRGRGQFLKLSNDTLCHSDDGLRCTLEAIRQYANGKPVLCFRSISHSAEDKIYNSMDDFWHARSIYSTWIAEFGTWKSDFVSADDFNDKADTNLAQVDYLLRLISRKKCAVIVQHNFFNVIPRQIIGLGGVNAAKVFGTNYLDLIAPYVASGEITSNTWEQEKRTAFKLVRNNFLTTSPKYRFPKDNYVHHLLKYFKWDWYFWASVPFVLIARIITPIRRIVNI